MGPVPEYGRNPEREGNGQKLAKAVSVNPVQRSQGRGLGTGAGPGVSHLQGTQSLLCRGLQTRLSGVSAQLRDSSDQEGRAHIPSGMRPLVLFGRFPVGKERHPEHLDTNDLGDKGGLQRKTNLWTNIEEEVGPNRSSPNFSPKLYTGW